MSRAGTPVVLDTRSTDLHTAVAAALGFPAHYGRNLDALADCLRDVDPATRVRWEGWEVVRDEHPRTFAVARRLLDAAVRLDLAD